MSTHNIYFHEEIKKKKQVLFGYSSYPYLDWLQSPVTKYFFSYNLFNNPLK